MKVKKLIERLSELNPDSDVRLAEYSDGRTLRWHVGFCCNTEHQAEIGQVWLTKQTLAESD